MKIGELALLGNVTVDTVRFYERKGLLAPPARTGSGYRDYGAGAVSRLRITKTLQELGLTLDEIVAVLGDADRGQATCAAEKKRFEGVLARLERKIAELSDVRDRMAKTLDECVSGHCHLLS